MLEQRAVQSIVEQLPNNPETIFKALNLPITYIDDAELFKTGRGRTFQYKGRDLFSPEIVAVVFYESQGHIASWNESLAISIIKNAFERLLTLNLFDQLEYIGVKSEAYLVSGAFDTANNRAITRTEQLALYEKNPEYAKRPDPASIDRQHAHEKLLLEKREDFPFSVLRLLKRQTEWIRFLIDGKVSIGCKCGPDELISLFHNNIDELKKSKNLLLDALQLPQKTDDKTDHHQKFINEWTMKFARSVIEECDFDYVLEEVFRYSLYSNRWDLTVIDKDTKKLRYVEVKMDDKFTPVQLTNIPLHLAEGGTLELCKVRPVAR